LAYQGACPIESGRRVVSGSRVPAALRLANWRRAQGKCEYCLLHEDDALVPHQPDHIIATQHGGQPSMDNLALACCDCNLLKGPNLISGSRIRSDRDSLQSTAKRLERTFSCYGGACSRDNGGWPCNRFSPSIERLRTHPTTPATPSRQTVSRVKGRVGQ